MKPETHLLRNSCSWTKTLADRSSRKKEELESGTNKMGERRCKVRERGRNEGGEGEVGVDDDFLRGEY